MAENLGLLNPYLVTGIGNNGAYNQPSQVGDIKLYCQAQVQILILLQCPGPPPLTPHDTTFVGAAFRPVSTLCI